MLAVVAHYVCFAFLIALILRIQGLGRVLRPLLDGLICIDAALWKQLLLHIELLPYRLDLFYHYLAFWPSIDSLAEFVLILIS